MFDLTIQPRSARAALLAVAMAVIASPAAGQEIGHETPAPSPRQLRSKLDSLLGLHAGAEREYQVWVRSDSVRRENLATPDSTKRLITIGSIRVVADNEVEQLARQAGTLAWNRLESMYGAEAAVLAQEVWLLGERRDTTKDSREVILMVGWDAVGELPTRRSHPAGLPFQNVRTVESAWLAHAEQVIADARHGRASNWFAGVLGASINDRALFEGVFRELATRHNPFGRGCLRGNIPDCRKALKVDTTSRLPVDATGRSLRLSLLRFVILVGGEGAYPRFVADTSRETPERLSAAAKMPLDSLVAAWRSHVISLRPPPASTPPRSAVMALVWGSLLCAVSLRSSRWR